METEKKIIGRCPLCGGNVVKTCKGYRCEHNIGDNPSCVLNINAIIGNRKMADTEVAVLLEKRRILLDGFAGKEGKTFPTVLELADDGNILMQPVIGRCPHCGGEIRVGSRAFNCSNYAKSVWEAGRSTAPTMPTKTHPVPSPSGVTSADTSSLWKKPGKSARRASPLRNWRCTVRTAASTASGSACRLTNFKS